MTKSPRRHRSLDVLRGLAIVGTLGTNVWIFTHPYGFIGYLESAVAPGTPEAWARVEVVAQGLAQGKFLGLLTLMFGIGLEIQRRSAVRRGLRWPGRYPWRAALLFLDGLLHYLLVTEFDVLMGYALTGAVVAYLLVTSERAQRGWMIVAGSLHLLAVTGLALLLAVLPSDGDQGPPMAFNTYADGSWWDLVLLRLDNAGLFRLEPVLIFGYSILMFLLGATLLRKGVLEPDGGPLRRRLMVLGAAGFAVDLVLQVAGGTAGVILGRYTTAGLVSLGILAVVVEVVRRRPDGGWVSRRLEEVGRAALSSYVLQNLVASTLSYGWGLGLASRFPDAWRVPGTIGVFLVTIAVVMTFAHLWLRRFPRGPVELGWLWCFDRIDAALGPARVVAPPLVPALPGSRQDG